MGCISRSISFVQPNSSYIAAIGLEWRLHRRPKTHNQNLKHWSLYITGEWHLWIVHADRIHHRAAIHSFPSSSGLVLLPLVVAGGTGWQRDREDVF